jgi:hypothetical protein
MIFQRKYEKQKIGVQKYCSFREQALPFLAARHSETKDVHNMILGGSSDLIHARRRIWRWERSPARMPALPGRGSLVPQYRKAV